MNTFVNTCEKGKTYKFINVRIGVDRNSTIFLQSTKEDGTDIQQAEQLENTVEGVLALKSNLKQLTGEFVGVDSRFNYRKCVLCGKK